LEQMLPRDRKGIGGFVKSWVLFGSMMGEGNFKHIINEHTAVLSNALNKIPREEPVQRAHYRAFIDKYIAAYPKKNGQPSGHGLATATRLLAMKRPDCFVCLDNANRAGLSTAFGITINNHDYDAYLDSIIELIFETKWWNSRRPNGSEEGQVWDGRVAFLDAIYYEEASRSTVARVREQRGSGPIKVLERGPIG
jgi:hypothetical protein